MATKGNSVPERIARWKVIAAGLQPQLEDMPHLAALHEELTEVIVESERLDARHEVLKGETRDVNRRRDELARTGDDLRNRLGAALRTLYGFKSEKLIEYGLKPQRTRGRAKKPPADTPPPVTPAVVDTNDDPAQP